MTECEKDLFTGAVVDSVFYNMKILPNFLDENAGFFLGPESLPDGEDGGPDIF